MKVYNPKNYRLFLYLLLVITFISFYHIYVTQNNIYGGFQHETTAEKESKGAGKNR